MVTDEYCFAEVGLPCLNSSAIAFGSMLYNSCCVLFCSIKSSCVLSSTSASRCFEYFSICACDAKIYTIVIICEIYQCLTYYWHCNVVHIVGKTEFCSKCIAHVLCDHYVITIIIIVSTGLSLFGFMR